MSFIFGGEGGGEVSSAGSEALTREGVEEIKRLLEQTRGDIQPFISTGQEQLQNLTQGTTAAGLDERLAQLFNTDIFGALVDERGRAVQNQLSSGGLTRSGTALREAAAVPTGIGLGLEELLTSRSRGLATQGLQAGLGLGGFTTAAGGQIGGLFGGQAGNDLQANIATQQLAEQQAQRQADFFNELIGGGASLGAAAIEFSDPGLKENIEKIGEIGPLTLYQWDWIKGAKGTIVEKCLNMGFMANEVKEKFPQYVSEYCGWMVINYEPLLNELEASNG